MNVVNKLRSSKDAAVASAAASLTTRVLIRIAKRLSHFPDHDVYEIVQQACLAKLVFSRSPCSKPLLLWWLVIDVRTRFRFLPPLTRKALNGILSKSGIHPTLVDSSSSIESYSVDEKQLTIGDTVIPRYLCTPASSHKVPDVLFYDSRNSRTAERKTEIAAPQSKLQHRCFLRCGRQWCFTPKKTTLSPENNSTLEEFSMLRSLKKTRSKK